MCEETHCDRRRFLGTAAMTMAAARLGLIGAADAQPSETTPAAVPTIKPGTHTCPYQKSCHDSFPDT
jgi:nitrous oxide reductase